MISISDKALCKPAGNLKGGTNNDNCFPTIKILNLIPLKVFNIDLDILKPIEAIVKATVIVCKIWAIFSNEPNRLFLVLIIFFKTGCGGQEGGNRIIKVVNINFLCSKEIALRLIFPVNTSSISLGSTEVSSLPKSLPNLVIAGLEKSFFIIKAVFKFD